MFTIHDPITDEEQDILERRYLAARIFNRLTDDACPGVIGIYGGWGTGKTSLLHLIQQKWKNSGDKTIQIEYIDAWNYEGSATLFVPVIVRTMSKRVSLVPEWSEYFARISRMALYLGSDVVLRALTGGINLDDLNKYKADMAATGLNPVSLLDWEELTDKVAETQTTFQKLIQKTNQKEKSKRVIFLIDNLDRCSPENAVALLESIKNFLAIDGCTWIFAMDSGVIASYINRKYEGTTMDGNSYLDKIIPEQYHLSFFPNENDSRIYKLIRSATGGELTLSDWKRLPLIPYVIVPRRLKKSAVRFAECFSGLDPRTAEPDVVFLLSLLYHTWPEFYSRLSSTSLKHVGGILAHFFNNEKPEDRGGQWGNYSPLPLDNKFFDNQDLIQFLQTAFPNAKAEPEKVVNSIKNAMSALRQVGLP
ncbi:MAG TPA: P-loop NTPase fold protein [Anaerolineales bacterium]|nr:P-loop NTPase fold protein [Anaerolineales bacterium]